VIVGGGTSILEHAPAGLLAFIRKASKTSRRIASICTGSFILAEAGILDGKRATTHWLYARDLQVRFSEVKMEEDRIFIIDGNVWTSAGMTAGIDLALAMAEKDLGADAAHAIAQKLVVFHRRAGGQSQHSALLELEPKSDRIQNALAYAKKNLHTPLSVERLAEAANLSPRQFSRAFRAETGQSPAKAVENLRLEAARSRRAIRSMWSHEKQGSEIGGGCGRLSCAPSVNRRKRSDGMPERKVQRRLIMDLSAAP
jgi:transcriptional regulator GlxA family with amidase domain